MRAIKLAFFTIARRDGIDCIVYLPNRSDRDILHGRNGHIAIPDQVHNGNMEKLPLSDKVIENRLFYGIWATAALMAAVAGVFGGTFVKTDALVIGGCVLGIAAGIFLEARKRLPSRIAKLPSIDDKAAHAHAVEIQVSENQELQTYLAVSAYLASRLAQEDFIIATRQKMISIPNQHRAASLNVLSRKWTITAQAT